MKRRRKRLMVIIPFSTMTRLADNVLDVIMFYASGADEDSLEPAENAFTELLMERFEQDEDAFSIVDQISQRSWKPCPVSPTPCL